MSIKADGKEAHNCDIQIDIDICASRNWVSRLIFLFDERQSPCILWKALTTGVGQVAIHDISQVIT